MITRIIVGAFELELTEDIAVPLNFSLQEFRYPEKRKRSFSKTINVPGTKNNMNFFISAYAMSLDIENTSSLKFKPNQAPQCIVKRGDLIIFRGLLKLNSVNIVNRIYTFDCTIYSEVVDIFTKLKSVNLSELDWSEYDHDLTRANVINSWDTSVIKNGVATSNFGVGTDGYNPLSFGYLYPLINFGFEQPDETTFRTNQLIPYVYVKECITKILDYAYKDTDIVVDYTTDFFNNENMKKLIYGYGGGDLLKISSLVVASALIETFNGTYSITENSDFADYTGWNYFPDFNLLDVVSLGLITQDENTINVTTGEVNINIKSVYTFNISISLNYACGGMVTNSSSGNFTRLYVYKNDVEVYTQTYNTLANTAYTLNFNFNLDLNPGDKIMFELYGGIGSTSYVVTTNITDFDFTMNADKSAILTDNSLVSLNSAIPNINCADFLKGIFNMFYATVSDPVYNPVTNVRTVYINSFSDFYSGQDNVDDWSSKIDELREINIECNSLIEGKNYVFQFNEEKDFFNNEYKRITGENYGELNQYFDTFQNDEKVFKLPFATYPPVKIDSSNLRIPHILTNDGTTIKPYKGKGMIAFYNGIRSGNCAIMNSADSTQTTKTVYPLVHHFRFEEADSYAPIFDLHYKSRQYTFDEITAYPSINIYSKYYSQFINELTSINSKLLIAYFKLNDKDISTMDFSKLKMINGSLFRLYSIKDYDSINYGTTKCELIKFLG